MSLQDYKKAGKIAAEALQFGKKLVKEDALLREVTRKTEDFIYKQGGRLAFPAQISLNNKAAHCYSGSDSEEKFKAGDLVKLDVGVHVNGYIGDNALSINVAEDNDLELIKASEDALREAISLMKPGVKLREIGKAVEEVIVGYGFNPIRNLSGHEVEKWNLHAGMIIPNYDNKSGAELEEGQVFAVEPFATTGVGKVNEGRLSGVYKIQELKKVRTGKELLNYIHENYRELPFSKDWLHGKFDAFKINNGFRILEQQGIIHRYPELVENERAKVSQAEHTVFVADKPIVLTQI
ncbi:type II methionyl aminopeptidase [Candidatus Woesearchaeota archaeon]|nr:type II methionyl aminopeptidase [Candidatus Woesearchaeota archaeon]